MNTVKQAIKSILIFSLLAGSSTVIATESGAIIGADNNSIENPFVQPQNSALSGGGRDQTMQFGDVIFGSRFSDLLIGGLGTDVLAGGGGSDVILGGVEHFNPANRDRAFGGSGNDTFIWKPGDGSDFWDGGSGHDVVIFGLVGEVDESIEGGISFAVSKDKQTAEIAIDPNSLLPLVDVTNSPGFCTVIDDSTSADAGSELAALDIDHLVRFSIRGIANAFEAGEQNTDNGLRVTLHLKDVETLICTSRDGGEIEVIDLSVTPARVIAHGVSSADLRRQIRSATLRRNLEAMVF